MQTHNVPQRLLDTWIWMVFESKDREIRQQGYNNLVKALGDKARVEALLSEKYSRQH